MSQTRLMLVGGFLGAGKTTLMARAATLLCAQGKHVGLITNDQASELVDTALLRHARLEVREIAGGCFCCRFGALLDTARNLVEEMAPDIIIGEPVGSCTDLSATVLQPLKDLCAERYRLAPLSVVVDPSRLWEVLEPRRHSPLHASARYILRKQVEEADVLLINKQDLLDAAELRDLLVVTREHFPGKAALAISALTGEGVAAWLATMMREDAAGMQIVDVDYDVYAEGEALLGWLNAAATITAHRAVDWPALTLEVLERLQHAMQVRHAEIAHVKLALTTADGQLLANLTTTTGAPTIRGHIDGTPSSATLLLNARVEMSHSALQAIVEVILHGMSDAQLTVRIDTMHSLSPGRPEPTYRYANVVEEHSTDAI